MLYKSSVFVVAIKLCNKDWPVTTNMYFALIGAHQYGGIPVIKDTSAVLNLLAVF